MLAMLAKLPNMFPEIRVARRTRILIQIGDFRDFVRETSKYESRTYLYEIGMWL